jgi:phosphomevalonate kinase
VRVAAPGKLVITGAYVVLEGASAIVCAVDRYALAEDRNGSTTREVSAALDPAPAIDASALEDGGQKLGLGSSAAALVAALGLRRAQAGGDLDDDDVRHEIFERAREVHARVQNGGSGVDVAASTFGGVLHYTLTSVEKVKLPRGVTITAFFSGTSARTSVLRERVDALKARDPNEHGARMTLLHEIAKGAHRAVRSGDATAFVAAVASTGEGLTALGVAADAPIVPPAFVELGARAKSEGAAFIPSGAGGGDVGIFVGPAPSAQFTDAARAAGMKLLSLAVEHRGVHVST